MTFKKQAAPEQSNKQPETGHMTAEKNEPSADIATSGQHNPAQETNQAEPARSNDCKKCAAPDDTPPEQPASAAAALPATNFPHQTAEEPATQPEAEHAAPALKDTHATKPVPSLAENDSAEPAERASKSILGLKLKPKSVPVKQFIQPGSEQFVVAEASVGLQHRNNQPYPLPCQDAVGVSLKPRPILIACDGAGSASMSEVGSSELVMHLTRLCQSIEPLIADQLDTPQPAESQEAMVRVVIRHAMGVLQDLSIKHRRSLRDFRSTLNFALVGKEQILWIKVGDGEIVQEKISFMSDAPDNITSELSCLGDNSKGEFANQTQFIDDQLKFDQVSWGCLNAKDITGLALMSDGAAEKLVANNRQAVSGQVSNWLQQLRQDKLKPSDLCKRFYSEEFCKQSTGDDRSIALWARALK